MKSKPRFTNNDQAQFFSTLKKRIDAYFKDNNLSKQGNAYMLIKTLAMLTLYLTPYFLILTGWFSVGIMALLVVVMGVGKAGIGMSVMHDANHGAYSSKAWLNKLMGDTLYLLGGNPAIWKIQHNVLHHTYTNVYEVDEDIETKFILRLSPHAECKPIHKYQYLYAVLLYGLMTFSFLIKDFIKVFRYRSDALAKTDKPWYAPFSQVLITKFIYLFFIVVVPYFVLNLSLGALLLGFLLLHFVAGMILSIIFQLAHVVAETEHFHVEEGENLENTWAIHQLKTTANFARKNVLLNWYIGGLNYQIEHHLFPTICHVHYPQISEIVKKTALEFGLPYNEQPTFWQALKSHFQMLRNLGKPTLQPQVS